MKFSPAERRNWGYWDGTTARERNRRPEWSPSSHCDRKHPFDQSYGMAFWLGWYGNQHPNTNTKET